MTIATFEERSTNERASLRDRKLRGYAAVFNSPTELMEGVFEQIAPGAFADTIATDDVRLVVEHDAGRLLARSSAGTLTLSEDAHGLKVVATLPDTTLGRDTATLLDRGDLDGMSFRFMSPPEKESWEQLPDGTELRTLEAVRLIDVSLVTFPAYVDATAALRSRDSFIHTVTIPARIVRAHRLYATKQGVTR